jgi:hypothetical protein
MNRQPECTMWGCQSDVLVGPLHGVNGGPLLCLHHRVWWDADDKRERQRKINLVEAFGFSTVGLHRDEPCYLTTETLEDAIFLCHPDRHPEERKAIANRATKELLALRGYTRPRPEPKLVVTNNASDSPEHAKAVTKPLKPILCESCFLTTPFFYCDACRKIHEAGQQRGKDLRNKKDRKRRARQRLRAFGYQPRKCLSCGSQFDGRKDARFCSNKCRVRQHRQRHHNQGKT